MGKNGKKRKKSVNSVDGASDVSSDQGDQTDQGDQSNQGNTSLLSRVLGATNRVLYGALDGQSTSPTPSGNVTPPATSTPISTGKKRSDAHDGAIHRKLDDILAKLSKLESLEAKYNQIDEKVQKIDDRVATVEKKQKEFERSLNFMSAAIDDLNLNAVEQRDTGGEQSELKTELESLKEENKRMRDIMVDLRCRSMKNNLIFTGLEGEHPDEDTEYKLRRFIYNELRIDHRIDFGNVHRFGRRTGGKPRPIVAKFLHHKDLRLCLNRANNLRGTQFGISEQFPSEVEDRRKQLYPVMRQLRQQGNRVKLVRDRLFVNGRPYDEDEQPMEQERNRPEDRPYHTSPRPQRQTQRTHSPSRRSDAGGNYTDDQDRNLRRHGQQNAH